jgi:branched-chain amino acid transport system permease protein
MYFILDLLLLGCINAIMATGVNLQYGYNGLLNVANYTFTAIGAYVAGVLTLGHAPQGTSWIGGWSLPWYVGLLGAGVAASVAGLIVFLFSIRRLRSDYLAIVTVAAAYIFYNWATADQSLFDGGNGIFGVPYIFGGSTITTNEYAALLLIPTGAILAICVWLSQRIFRSPFGRLLRAVREDEVVVKAFGRTVWHSQLKIYTLGCFMSGLAGAMFVFYITAWSPSAFLPGESFFILAAVIIGGTGNYWGGLLGAFVVVEGLNELTRYLPNFGYPADFGAGRVMLIGVGLLLVLRYRPEGLFPERWLHWYERRPVTLPVTLRRRPLPTAVTEAEGAKR